MNTEPQRTCPSCGNELSGAMEFCPVCMLRKGLAGGVESGESSFEEAVKPAPDEPTKRFEHYELISSIRPTDCPARRLIDSMSPVAWMFGGILANR